MPNTEEVVDMDNLQTPPLWIQEHEHRLTKNEKDIEKLNSDMSLLRGENNELRMDIREIKDMLNNNNKEQLNILNEMNAQMRDEFFKKKSVSHSERWKMLGIIVTGIVGGGGLLTTAIVTILKLMA